MIHSILKWKFSWRKNTSLGKIRIMKREDQTLSNNWFKNTVNSSWRCILQGIILLWGKKVGSKETQESVNCGGYRLGRCGDAEMLLMTSCFSMLLLRGLCRAIKLTMNLLWLVPAWICTWQLLPAETRFTYGFRMLKLLK